MPAPEPTRVRLRMVAVVMVSLFAALTARLWYLQVLTNEVSAEVATTNITREVVVPAPRGRILDASGKVLVDNRITTVVSLNRGEINDALGTDAEARTAMFTQLARQINRSGNLLKVSQLERAFNDTSYSAFANVPVAYDVDDDLMVFIGERAQEFPGIEVAKQTVRAYPYGTLAAHVIGYVGPINEIEFAARKESQKQYQLRDEIGKSGIELFLEDQLRGQPGRRVLEVNASNEVIRERVDDYVAPVGGNDVYLTLDIDLQATSEAELLRALEMARRQKADAGEPAFNAPVGSVVVLDPSNGNVLAMASYPTFDPNDSIGGFSAREWSYLQNPANFGPLLNRATQGQYAPGSTFKLITAVAAMENQAFAGDFIAHNWNQLVDDPGSYYLRSCTFEQGDQSEAAADAGCKFNNAETKPNKGVDLPRAMTVSSDWYFYQLGEAFEVSTQLPDDGIQNEAEAFGFGHKTGITLPSLTEATGFVPTAERTADRHDQNPEAFPDGLWSPGDNVQFAIGQSDLLVTPLQLANAYATYGNGGIRYAPNLVSRVVQRDASTGDEVDVVTFGPREAGKVEISPETRAPITQGLVGAVGDPTGTAFSAFQPSQSEAPTRGSVDVDLSAFPVAGKTGTAQITGKADTSLFAAFAPVESPRFAVAAIIEEGGFGSGVAAPLVARILKPLAEGTLPEARPQAMVSARFQALPACQDWQAAQAAGTTTTVPPTTAPQGPTTTITPEITVSRDGTVEANGQTVDCLDVLAEADQAALDNGEEETP